MALIQKQGEAVSARTLTDNDNFLSPLGFRFQLNRAPNVEYFCKTASLPTISLNEAPQSNPMVVIARPGDRLNFEPLSITFGVDEDMTNYLELFNWMLALGHPTDLNQYKALSSEVVSDGSIIVLTSHNNANIRISYTDLWPMTLSPLTFDIGQIDLEYLEAECTFRYRQFQVEKL